jgi:hypothetical protein
MSPGGAGGNPSSGGIGYGGGGGAVSLHLQLVCGFFALPI